MEAKIVIGWVILGLAAGVIARLFVPKWDPAGWIVTVVLGIVGSGFGGMIAYGPSPETYSPATSGWITSTIGAVGVLSSYYWMTGVRKGA
jgi:uncharacterized membrane protein YeaQ/YmgE (transglycosylase-associated protein family)